MKLSLQIPKDNLEMFDPLQAPSSKNTHMPKLQRSIGIRDFIGHVRKDLYGLQARISKLECLNGILALHSDEHLGSFIRLVHNQYLIRHLRRKSLELLCEIKLLTIN